MIPEKGYASYEGMGYKINIKHPKFEDVVFNNTLLISTTEQFFAYSDVDKIQRTIERNLGELNLSFLSKEITKN